MESPPFQRESEELNYHLQGFSREELTSLMGISPALADQTYREIREFSTGTAGKKPAIFAYSGTVFKTLNPGSFAGPQLRFAQKHLRILSGYYGILTPFSKISPYRLEMKTPLNLPEDKSLTSFWKLKVSDYLKNESSILNLASGEYSSILDKRAFKGKFVTFFFKELNGDKLKTIGMYAKIARGLMLRRILMERIVDLRILQQGKTGGYLYNENLSTENDWVFTRKNTKKEE